MNKLKKAYTTNIILLVKRGSSEKTAYESRDLFVFLIVIQILLLSFVLYAALYFAKEVNVLKKKVAKLESRLERAGEINRVKFENLDGELDVLRFDMDLQNKEIESEIEDIKQILEDNELYQNFPYPLVNP